MSASSARVEHGRSHAARRGGQRRGGQAPGVDHDHHVAVLLDAVLVAHRPPQAGGRAPVDLADVVVGQVVAHQLELGARGRAGRGRRRPGRGSGPGARRARAGGRPAGRGRRRPRRAPGAVVPGGEPERPGRARADGRAARGARGGARAGSRRARRRPRAARARARAARPGARARATPAGASLRTAAPPGTPRASTDGRSRAYPRRPAGGGGVDRGGRHQRGDRQRGEAERDDERRERERGEQRGRPRRRAHRGTGTASSALRTAAPGVKRSSSASGVRTSRWCSTGTAMRATSSGVT